MLFELVVKSAAADTEEARSDAAVALSALEGLFEGALFGLAHGFVELDDGTLRRALGDVETTSRGEAHAGHGKTRELARDVSASDAGWVHPPVVVAGLLMALAWTLLAGVVRHVATDRSVPEPLRDREPAAGTSAA